MKRLVVLLSLVVALAPLVALAGSPGGCDGTPEECVKKLYAKISAKPWLGIEMDADASGAFVVTKVVEGSPAEQAGFQAGDVLLAMNGVKYSKDNKPALKEVYADLTPGSSADYVVKRGDGKVKLTATFAHVPETLMAQWIGEHMLSEHLHVKLASK